MTKHPNDPRDIERIAPDSPNADTNTNNISVLGEPDDALPIKGAVLKEEGEPKGDKHVFPGKGKGENKKAGGSHAA